MKFALVKDELQEAQPGLSGKCKGCGEPTIAKCGEVKIWHWAHLGKLMCDPWWENETEWHRAWKDRFPKEWQEVIHPAENGKRHFADVRTDQGYVIEFQHSHIKPEHRQDRENCYKKMVWIVDGTRRLRDKDTFAGVWEQSMPLDQKVPVRKLWGYFFDECALLRDWRDSNAPVFFDFGEDILSCILPSGFLPKATEVRRYVFRINRSDLIAFLLPASSMSFEALLKNLYDFLIAKEAWLTHQQRFQAQDTNYSSYQRIRRPNFRL